VTHTQLLALVKNAGSATIRDAAGNIVMQESGPKPIQIGGYAMTRNADGSLGPNTIPYAKPLTVDQLNFQQLPPTAPSQPAPTPQARPVVPTPQPQAPAQYQAFKSRSVVPQTDAVPAIPISQVGRRVPSKPPQKAAPTPQPALQGLAGLTQPSITGRDNTFVNKGFNPGNIMRNAGERVKSIGNSVGNRLINLPRDMRESAKSTLSTPFGLSAMAMR
jgi:hypothetical protein